MRFYKGAHDYLFEASKKEWYDQHLYLVAEADNKHDTMAVMLHNGKQKLGSVSSTESTAIRHLFAVWKAQGVAVGRGPRDDDVVVCSIDKMGIDPVTFEFKGNVVVHGKYRVNERLARKYAGKMLNLKE